VGIYIFLYLPCITYFYNFHYAGIKFIKCIKFIKKFKIEIMQRIFNFSFIATVVFLCLFFVSCNSTQSRIDSVKKQIENAEENLDDFSEKEWNRLVSDLKELKNDYVKNKENYTVEQRKELGRLKGRFTTLQIKKGFRDILIDFGSEIDGIFNGN